MGIFFSSALLAQVDLHAKQEALRRVWTRFVWRVGLESGEVLPGPDAFDTMCAEAAQKMQKFNAQDFANTLWAIAK